MIRNAMRRQPVRMRCLDDGRLSLTYRPKAATRRDTTVVYFKGSPSPLGWRKELPDGHAFRLPAV